MNSIDDIKTLSIVICAAVSFATLVIGTILGVYYTELKYIDEVCKIQYQYTNDYLICKDKLIQDILWRNK